jgi:hypothetical protein
VIVLTTPIRFGTLPATHPDSKLRADTHLPAYIQLFHENGDLRECDPLPLYTRDDSDVIMTEPALAAPTLPNTKPVPSGVPLLPPLADRATPPPAPAETQTEEDYPMESDSSGSDSDGDSESDSSGDSASAASEASGSIPTRTPSPSQTFLQDQHARELEHRAERERERDRDRQRRINVQRERERQTRSQAPPPTPRTPGGRKAVRVARSVRAVA